MTLPNATKRESLTIRIKPEERCLIDQAAQLLGKNRTDFMLEATRRAADGSSQPISAKSLIKTKKPGKLLKCRHVSCIYAIDMAD